MVATVRWRWHPGEVLGQVLVRAFGANAKLHSILREHLQKQMLALEELFVALHVHCVLLARLGNAAQCGNGRFTADALGVLESLSDREISLSRLISRSPTSCRDARLTAVRLLTALPALFT